MVSCAYRINVLNGFWKAVKGVFEHIVRLTPCLDTRGLNAYEAFACYFVSLPWALEMFERLTVLDLDFRAVQEAWLNTVMTVNIRGMEPLKKRK